MRRGDWSPLAAGQQAAGSARLDAAPPPAAPPCKLPPALSPCPRSLGPAREQGYSPPASPSWADPLMMAPCWGWPMPMSGQRIIGGRRRSFPSAPPPPRTQGRAQQGDRCESARVGLSCATVRRCAGRGACAEAWMARQWPGSSGPHSAALRREPLQQCTQQCICVEMNPAARRLGSDSNCTWNALGGVAWRPRGRAAPRSIRANLFPSNLFPFPLCVYVWRTVLA